MATILVTGFEGPRIEQVLASIPKEIRSEARDLFLFGRAYNWILSRYEEEKIIKAVTDACATLMSISTILRSSYPSSHDEKLKNILQYFNNDGLRLIKARHIELMATYSNDIIIVTIESILFNRN